VNARVVHESDCPLRETGEAATRAILIPEDLGGGRIVQQVIGVGPGGEAHIPSTPTSDTVGYVVSGQGSLLNLDENRHELHAGHAVLLAGHEWRLLNPGNADLVVLLVMAPPWRAQSMPVHVAQRLRQEHPPRPPVVIHEDDQPAEPAGDDREFRLLIDPRHGARNVTQFVGFIDRSKAPFHTHSYEEAIYILEGEGIVHVAGNEPFDAPIRPGTSIFLPPATPHCLENASPGVLKLLGVFSPPGSPAMKRD
jgi:mannose-6-phosphate isomerase-like protein (cupin superfamily)